MHNGGVESYREHVRWPGWFVVSLGLVLVGALFALGASRATPTWTLGILTVPFLLGAYGIWRMRFIALEFGPEGVAFGFGRLSRRVPRERVVGAEAMAYPAVRFMGWGYRLGWEPRERAYSVLGCPRGVLVTFDDERGRRWRVFLSSRDPERAVAALGS